MTVGITGLSVNRSQPLKLVTANASLRAMPLLTMVIMQLFKFDLVCSIVLLIQLLTSSFVVAVMLRGLRSFSG